MGPRPGTIGLNMSSLRCLEEADADVENSAGFDQHCDALHDDNTEYSNQERKRKKWIFLEPIIGQARQKSFKSIQTGQSCNWKSLG